MLSCGAVVFVSNRPSIFAHIMPLSTVSLHTWYCLVVSLLFVWTVHCAGSAAATAPGAGSVGSTPGAGSFEQRPWQWQRQWQWQWRGWREEVYWASQ
jgi:hypothetical protein